MDDQQLVDLVQRKPPEDLTLQEIQWLRERLIASPELRRFLCEQLQMGQYLADALGRVDLTLETIAASSDLARQPRGSEEMGLAPDSHPERPGKSGLPSVLFSQPLRLTATLAAFGSVVILSLAGLAGLVLLMGIGMPPRAENRGTEVAADDDVAADQPPDDVAAFQVAEDFGEAVAEDEPPKPEHRESDLARKKTAPWHRLLQLQPRPLDEVWLEGFEASGGALSLGDLKTWFAPVRGYSHQFHETRRRTTTYGMMDGLLRLSAPLPESAVLKFALAGGTKFDVHIFHGNTGVTIQCHQHGDRVWAAYATSRQPGSAMPETYALTSTDGARGHLSEVRYAAACLLWYRAGEIVVSLGDVVILRAPLPGPPTDVFVEGKAYFDGLTLVPAKGLPPPRTARPIVARIDNPAELNWAGVLPNGAEVAKRSDGAIQLLADRAGQPVWIAAKLPASGLNLVELLVEDATAGTSVFLGREAKLSAGGKKAAPDGQPHFVVGFGGGRRKGATWVQPRPHGTPGHRGRVRDGALKLQQHVGPSTWVRLLGTPGHVKYWLSSDGIHWAGPFALARQDTRGLTYVGLGCSAKTPGARIRLRRIVQRELSGMASLAEAGLRAKAPALSHAAKVDVWLAEVRERRPDGVELAEWQRACAVRTLGAGCSAALGQELLDLLLDDEAVWSLPVDERLRLLDEAALLVPVDRPKPLRALLERYRRLAIRAHRAGQPRPFSLIRRPVMMAPRTTTHTYRVLDPVLIRKELIELVYGNRWEEVDRLCREVRFFSGTDEYYRRVAPLADWARAMAARHLPRRAGTEPVAATSAWRGLLSEQADKEAYNVQADLEIALRSQSYRDACAIISTLEPASTTGLAPSGQDERLLLSLPAAVESAIHGDPQLRTVMNRQFGALARLHVRQATSAGDEAAVELATVRFCGTEAACEAHCWLGDRALSGGRFARAMAQYRLAQRTAPADRLGDLAARIRLAAAMVGLDVGKPIVQTVQLTDQRMDALEFEKLVANSLASRAGTYPKPRRWGLPAPGSSEAPRPGEFRVRQRSRFDGEVGDPPQYRVRGLHDHQVHWGDRQFAAAVEQDVMYVSNRFQVAAYDLANGQRKWQSPPAPGRRAHALHWPLVPMGPVIAGQRVFARQLNGDGPVLVCLERNHGQVVWAFQDKDAGDVISDPIVGQGELHALTLIQDTAQTRQLRLTRFDPDTGKVLAHHRLLQVRDSWFDRRFCRAAPQDDLIVAALDGVVLCCDLSGRVRWVRQQLALPAKEDLAWVTQYHDVPLVSGSTVYVTSPGVPTVDCIELDTGRLLFSRVLPDVKRLMGIVGEQLIVQTDTGLRTLRLDTGEDSWTHDATGLLDAWLCGGDGGFLYSRTIPARDKSSDFDPQLVWLDPKTGRAVARHSLVALRDRHPRLGAMVAHRGRIWVLYGRAKDNLCRDVVELIP